MTESSFPFKGVHLIIEAFRHIKDPRIECYIYGDVDIFPEFKERLDREGIPPSVHLGGAVAFDAVAAVFSEIDLLIVPSIWYENSPLTIHEAYLAGVPVLCADQGGMAELVEPGKTGLHFRLGDAVDLRRQLLRLVEEPQLFDSLTREFPRVTPISEDAAATVARYRGLIGQRRASAVASGE